MSGIPGMLTRSEAADRVSKSERTIRTWEKDGLRTILGLIPERDLLEWDRNRKVGRPPGVKPPTSILQRFVSGNYAEVLASLTDDEKASLSEELLEVAEVIVGGARG